MGSHYHCASEQFAVEVQNTNHAKDSQKHMRSVRFAVPKCGPRSGRVKFEIRAYFSSITAVWQPPAYFNQSDSKD